MEKPGVTLQDSGSHLCGSGECPTEEECTFFSKQHCVTTSLLWHVWSKSKRRKGVFLAHFEGFSLWLIILDCFGPVVVQYITAKAHHLTVGNPAFIVISKTHLKDWLVRLLTKMFCYLPTALLTDQNYCGGCCGGGCCSCCYYYCCC